MNNPLQSRNKHNYVAITEFQEVLQHCVCKHTPRDWIESVGTELIGQYTGLMGAEPHYAVT